MPISAINILRVTLLLMIVRLVSNVNNLVKQRKTKLGAAFRPSSCFVSLHFVASDDPLFDKALRRFLHRGKHLTLLLLSEVLVQVAASFILCLPQRTILCDDFFALFGAPYFIIKFFFLI